MLRVTGPVGRESWEWKPDCCLPILCSYPLWTTAEPQLVLHIWGARSAVVRGARRGEPCIWRGVSEHTLPMFAWCSDFSIPLLWFLFSHRKLFVFLAVLVCLMTSSLIVFFLFPRSVAVQPAGLNSSSVAFDEADIHLNITVGGCPCPRAPAPPVQQHFYVALVQHGDSGRGGPGIFRQPEGEAGTAMSVMTLNRIGTPYREGSELGPEK